MQNPQDTKKEIVTYRRLSLCKQLFLHGYNYSYKKDSLSRMIAVHNLHNSIEIFLRSLFLHYEIRQEKTINIEFEAMITEIENWFKDKNKKIPFRQELRNLNQQRNHVQHHALEPEESTMDYWRVYTYQFMLKSFDLYYSLNFDSFSTIELINDSILKKLLIRADNENKIENYQLATCYAKLAFQIATFCFNDVLPSEGLLSPFFLKTKFNGFPEIEKLIDDLSARIKKSEKFSIILSSGISAADYTKYISLTPNIEFAINGHPIIIFRNDNNFTSENFEWVYNSTINWILHWQNSGLIVKTPDYFIEQYNNIAENGLEN